MTSTYVSSDHLAPLLRIAFEVDPLLKGITSRPRLPAWLVIAMAGAVLIHPMIDLSVRLEQVSGAYISVAPGPVPVSIA